MTAELEWPSGACSLAPPQAPAVLKPHRGPRPGAGWHSHGRASQADLLLCSSILLSCKAGCGENERSSGNHHDYGGFLET